MNYLVPVVGCYHNLTCYQAYPILSVDENTNTLMVVDDNEDVCWVIVDDELFNSFEIHWIN